VITTFTARPARQNHEPPPCITLDMDPAHLPHACQHPIHRPEVVRHMSDHHPKPAPRLRWPGNFAGVIANDRRTGPARPEPASCSPLAPTRTRWARSRPETVQKQHARAHSTACQEATLSQVWPLGAAWLCKAWRASASPFPALHPTSARHRALVH
jgi:hypothetical protein